ncbi:MAG: alpha/beta family hydrolase [Acetobacteraceae bacterium]
MAAGIESILYLPGSSYPADKSFEDALLPRLAGRLVGVRATPYEAFIAGRGAPAAWNDPFRRLALLEAVLPTDGSGLVLIGRSSGARIATLYARHYKVAAVVCLGYPFRHPRRALDPARTRHLAGLATPTLIIQGIRDPYGGTEVVEDHVLAPAIRLRFIDAGHRFDLAQARWDTLADEIVDFLGRRAETPPVHGLRFDEDFYRSCHPDVVAAIAAGKFASGADHYRRFGQRQKRRFRLLPDPLPRQ